MNLDDPTLQRMQNLIEAWESLHDRRAIFLGCYALMTANIMAVIQAGEFEDNAWVRRLLERFADYYFVALQAFEQREGAPEVWKLTFTAASLPQVHVLQNLFLGVNAHINYDLVFSLVDVLEAEWRGFSSEERQSRYRDHCKVNEVITQTIDSVQDHVIESYTPALDWIDKVMGPLDEWLTSRLIADWRDEVWNNAACLLHSSVDSERELLLQEIEQRSLERAHAILGQAGLAGFATLL